MDIHNMHKAIMDIRNSIMDIHIHPELWISTILLRIIVM